MLNTICLGVVQDWEQVGRESCPTSELFSPLSSGIQVNCKHFESGTVSYTLYTALSLSALLQYK